MFGYVIEGMEVVDEIVKVVEQLVDVLVFVQNDIALVHAVAVAFEAHGTLVDGRQIIGQLPAGIRGTAAARPGAGASPDVRSIAAAGPARTSTSKNRFRTFTRKGR